MLAVIFSIVVALLLFTLARSIEHQRKLNSSMQQIIEQLDLPPEMLKRYRELRNEAR